MVLMYYGDVHVQPAVAQSEEPRREEDGMWLLWFVLRRRGGRGREVRPRAKEHGSTRRVAGTITLSEDIVMVRPEGQDTGQDKNSSVESV
jgi:hypothetical protein